MKKNITSVFSGTAVCFVLLGYANTAFGAALLTSTSTFSDIIDNILKLFQQLIPLLIGAAVIVFLYGVLVFIAKSSVGNADGRKDGINFMIFGIIGIAVMVSVWGLVAFVTSTFGTGNAVPQFNTTPNGTTPTNDNTKLYSH